MERPKSRFHDEPCRVLQLATQSATAYRFAMPLAKHLRSRGYSVSLGCSDELQPDVPSFHDEIRREGFALEIVPIPRNIRPAADLKALLALVRLLKAKKFDFVHTHNSKAGLIGRLAARIAGVPYVVHTNHGLPFFKSEKFSTVQSLVFWFLEAGAARLSDRVLAVSSAESLKAERFGIARPPKLVNVGQGLNTDYYSPASVSTIPDSEKTLKLKKVLEGRTVLGSVGRLVSEKGFDVLIEAVKICISRHPDLVVVLAGDGPERQSLEHRVRRLNLESRFIFLGQIADQDELRKLYTLMDIFILPTRWESFGMVFAEAMAMEVPVIGTKMEPISTVVKDGETGLLAPLNDIPSLANAIQTLLDDVNRRSAMGLAGRRRVLDLWDEKKMLARVEATYRELLTK